MRTVWCEPGHRSARYDIWAAINTLTAKQREALILYFWDDMTQEEIAGVVGIGREMVSDH